MYTEEWDDAIQELYEHFPELCDHFPSLCDFPELCDLPEPSDELELVLKLQLIREVNPSKVRIKSSDGQTVLHWAARQRYLFFCQIFYDASHELVSDVDNAGRLPLHEACDYYNIETAAFLLGLYPKGANTPDHNGSYPLHDFLLGFDNSDPPDVQGIEFLKQLLQKCDERVLSTPNQYGYLPLHIACDIGLFLPVVEAIYNAYPEAIDMETDDGDTPVDLTYNDEIETFLNTQLDVVDKAEKDTALLHDALYNPNVPMGTIKLMIDANPQSIRRVDDKGYTPLHIACVRGLLNAVKYIVQTDRSALQILDSRGNSPLHLACYHGHCAIIHYILTMSDFGVSLRNIVGRTPIEALLLSGSRRVERHSLEYLEALRCLLHANPALLTGCLG